MKISSALGGLAGAAALTLLNETVKRIDKDAPRLGMNAVAKLVKGTSIKSSIVSHLMPVSLAGDLISNSMYFGMANSGEKRGTLIRGALLGIGAGVGAVSLAKPMGLDERTVAASTKTKALTIAWYLIGGLVAAAVINLIDKRED